MNMRDEKKEKVEFVVFLNGSCCCAAITLGIVLSRLIVVSRRVWTVGGLPELSDIDRDAVLCSSQTRILTGVDDGLRIIDFNDR